MHAWKVTNTIQNNMANTQTICPILKFPSSLFLPTCQHAFASSNHLNKPYKSYSFLFSLIFLYRLKIKEIYNIQTNIKLTFVVPLHSYNHAKGH